MLVQKYKDTGRRKMTMEELLNTAIFASKYPAKSSGGQRALGQFYKKLNKLDFNELQYYFSDEDLIHLFVAVMEETRPEVKK